MVRRTQKLSKNNSLFLFGARGTGKTTLLRELYSNTNPLWIDLLSDKDEDRFGRNPDELSQVLKTGQYNCVVIDEIQKAPKLLDIVHREIEKYKKIQFVLTGSSARKLKRGSANLLAGRAFTYHLFPLTYDELGDQFDLHSVLEFGSLPKLLDFSHSDEKNEFLRSYVKTYLREEIQVEQLIRKLNPFRDFLEIAAQCNGKIINYSKIARDVGVDDKTIQNYFTILEDTLVGFHLPSFHRSIRKQQRESPKFYLFDTGVTRALSGTLRVDLVPKTYAFGATFEHFIILECFRKNEYLKRDYKFSYLKTKQGVEVDLITERPGEPDLLIEIKSTSKANTEHVAALKNMSKDWDKPFESQLWSLDENEKVIDGVKCLHWRTGLNYL